MGIKMKIFQLIDLILLGLFYLSKGLTLIAPPSVIKWIFESLGYAFYYGRPRMRRDLLKKISEAMPEITDPGELRRIARGACTAMVKPIYEGLLFWRHTDRFMREVEIENLEVFDDALAQGRGILPYTMHLPSTVMLVHAIMARLNRGYSIIAWSPEDLPVKRYTSKMAEFGLMIGSDPELPVIFAGPGRDAVKQLRDHLSKGGGVGFAVDIPGKCVVPLFGKPAAVADGIAHLAWEFDSPIIPTVMIPEEGFRRRIIFFEPIRCEKTGDRKADVKRTMEKVIAAGEKQVRMIPDQWMCWFGLWRWWEKAKELEASSNCGESTEGK